jgi:hypothetical protein
MTAVGAFTLADLDEWITDVQGGSWDTVHVPNAWARANLAVLLGEPVPYRLWTHRNTWRHRPP